MKKKILAIFLSAIIFACPAFAQGMGAIEMYDEAMEYFYCEEYGIAADYFRKAGNYHDAKKWTYYCEAIELAMEELAGSKELSGAAGRFEILAAQSFQDADQWLIYLKGREYEMRSMTKPAAEEYAKVLIHDSVQRYLSCNGKPDLLKGQEQSINELAWANELPADLSAEEYFSEGMDAYYFEEYELAAMCFSAAGNYQNAKEWFCYTHAVSLVIDDDNIEDASLLFRLLSNRSFQNAEDWVIYLKARDYESINKKAAMDLYKSIFIYDSSERYLKLRSLMY